MPASLLLLPPLLLLAAAAPRAAAAFASSAFWPRAPAPAPAGKAGWPALLMRASAPGDSWQVLTNTYLSEGSDITNGSMTVAQAEAQCGALPGCKGFTYDGASSPGPSYNVFLKSSVSAGAGAGWVTYVKEVPRILTGSFSNSAVIQHDLPCLSGYGANVTGAAVSVSTDADGGAPHATTVGADNTWRLCLPAQAPGGPWTLNVSVAGFGSETLTDILFGEVWVASGQSEFVSGAGANARALLAAIAVSGPHSRPAPLRTISLAPQVLPPTRTFPPLTLSPRFAHCFPAHAPLR